jgi:hypothetical protein
MAEKRIPILEIHPDLTHIRGDDKLPLCNTKGARNFSNEPKDATCRRCRKRAGLHVPGNKHS